MSTGDDFEKAGDPIAEAIGVLLWQETCFIFLRKFFSGSNPWGFEEEKELGFFYPLVM